MDDDGLEWINSFLIVAREKSFRRSAEILHIDRSALSRRIQKLEQQIGFALLERTTRDVSLTPAGRMLYESGGIVLDRYRDAVEEARDVSQGKTGTLRIGYMAFAATTLMPKAVAAYHIQHPKIDLKLRYIRTQGQKIALANDEIDIGYLIGPFDHSDYHSLPLGSDPLVAVMSPVHPLASLPTIAPTDIHDQELILGDMNEWEAYRWHLTNLFSAEGIAPLIKLEASNTLALIGLVAAGLGITICPQSLVDIFGPTIVVKPIHHPAFAIDTELVWKRNNRTTTLHNFVDAAKSALLE